jgi:hypothetical protein
MYIKMNQTLYFLYSKYSLPSSKVYPTIQLFSQYLPIESICIDDPITRSRLNKTIVKTVPSIISQTNTKIQVFEDQDFYTLLQKLGVLYEQEQQRLEHQRLEHQKLETQLLNQTNDANVSNVSTISNESNSVTTIASTIATQSNKPLSTDLNVTSNINSRLQPQEFSSPPLPQPKLTNQIVQTTNPQANAISQLSLHQQQLLESTPTNPPPMGTPMGVGNTSTTLDIQAPSSFSGQGELQILDESMLQNTQTNSGLFSNTDGYTMSQINGGSGGSGSRDQDRRQSPTKLSATQMQMEREMLDNQSRPPGAPPNFGR